MARNWKKMSKEDEDKKRQETIDKAIETMNKGIYEYLDSDRFKTLLDTMSKFHDYSLNNTLLILEQNPRATQLAGYNKWQQDFNRQVKRGEKGLMIWMPVEIKVKENHYVLDENGIIVKAVCLKEVYKMNHITFKDKEGFDINVLAFDGESNFAILDRSSTGSPTPYVVVKGLDTESATWSNSEGYFDDYDDCVRKYKSSVLEHTKSDIPMKAMFAYLLRRDVEPMLTRTLTDDEVWQAFDSFMQNDDFASLLDREIVPMALDIIEENERRENLKIQDIIDAPLKWDSKMKPDGVFIGMTVSDFVFSHGLYQNMKLNDFNELLAKEGYSTFPNKQYPFTNLERMISDEEFKLDVLNISNNLNNIYDETDFVYEKGIEESDVAEVVFDGICDDYELSRLVNKCEGKDQLKDFVAHCEDIQGLFINAVEMEIQEMEI